MITPDLCIYHGNCDDGFAAAWAVWKAVGDAMPTFYHAAVYGEPPPDVTNRNVVIVDFSYKWSVTVAMASKAKSILILDHHKTAQNELRDLGDCANVEVEFDMNRSGAVMAWDHFHPGEQPPRFLQYIQDRDLWTKVLPGVDEFTAALRSYPQDFGVWNEIATDVDFLINEGKAILRFYRGQVEMVKKHAFQRKIAGYDVPVVNGSVFMASEVAGELAEGNPFAAMYAETETSVIWSLRSRAPDGLDVSEIAKKFGGGGHKHAAGFTIPRP